MKLAVEWTTGKFQTFKVRKGKICVAHFTVSTEDMGPATIFPCDAQCCQVQ